MEAKEITLLSFQIREDNFAVDAMQVLHILDYKTVRLTPVPNTPDHLLGIINLHGNIIPVADMRVIMEKDDLSIGSDASIVVLNPEEQEDAVVGILVDMVKEVIETKEDQLQETVLEGKKGLIESFQGTLVFNNEFIHVIDINNLIETIEK
ncbi:chemotaxis protein CheW [Xiashengella succiniciproducens]|jgi:purine-binding chemotaxis protein CheW|uniref:Chemotaxis protein CheW n=1 Tax=Xiashengella succiniciproducens TaxID=2949635 RepID=A0A9J6ZPJ4_9BACT|nr:chemotaxis protein CheW [Alkaliflexus sp. Ai-910]URW79844.1 chemotaxis protein CheW [Alkaliflexus sp. Ai-910]